MASNLVRAVSRVDTLSERLARRAKLGAGSRLPLAFAGALAHVLARGNPPRPAPWPDLKRPAALGDLGHLSRRHDTAAPAALGRPTNPPTPAPAASSR